MKSHPDSESTAVIKSQPDSEKTACFLNLNQIQNSTDSMKSYSDSVQHGFHEISFGFRTTWIPGNLIQI